MLTKDRMRKQHLLLLILLLPIISANSVEYFHPNGSAGEDCFDGTCLTMNYHGPVYNSEGNANWGCGPCDNIEAWGGENIKSTNEIGCVSGMKNVAGVGLCFEADNSNLWDITFTHWSSAGLNEFGYVRELYSGEIAEEKKNEETLRDKKNETATTNTQEEETIQPINIEQKESDKSTTKQNKIIPLSIIIILGIVLVLLFLKLQKRKKRHKTKKKHKK